MARLRDEFRNHTLQLLSTAFSSLTVGNCAYYLGLSHEGALEVAKNAGWSLDGEFLRPVAPVAADKPAQGLENLKHLTSYIVYFDT